MKSTLFASALASALTATSFGQVEVELVVECCANDWQHTYENQVLTFVTTQSLGYTRWSINVPEDTVVSFALGWLGDYLPLILDAEQPGSSSGPFASLIDPWNAQGSPSFWTGSFVLPAGSYLVYFAEFEGVIDFNSAVEVQGSCCVNSGCASIAEADCSEMGGTWTEGGSCDDCEPVADDCPADVDGDGSIGFSDVLNILNDWGACP